MREDRPRLELEEGAAVGVLLHDVGADDVGGHQVGRELNARKLEVENLGERVHEAGLADARDALEQNMAAREQARDGQTDDLVVPDDPPADLARDAQEPIAELLDRLLDAGGRHC